MDRDRRIDIQTDRQIPAHNEPTGECLFELSSAEKLFMHRVRRYHLARTWRMLRE